MRIKSFQKEVFLITPESVDERYGASEHEFRTETVEQAELRDTPQATSVQPASFLLTQASVGAAPRRSLAFY